MFSIDFLMLSACDEEITERSSSCFNAEVLFAFKKSICLFRSPILAFSEALSFSSPVFRRFRFALSSLQAFSSPCKLVYFVCKTLYSVWEALYFLLLTQENNKTADEAINMSWCGFM